MTVIFSVSSLWREPHLSLRALACRSSSLSRPITHSDTCRGEELEEVFIPHSCICIYSQKLMTVYESSKGFKP